MYACSAWIFQCDNRLLFNLCTHVSIECVDVIRTDISNLIIHFERTMLYGKIVIDLFNDLLLGKVKR